MPRRRITMDMDHSLLAALDAAARLTHQSRNEFLLNALRSKLQEHERQRVDAEFARMAHDADYHHELASLERDLAPASDLAWRSMDAAEAREGAGT